MSSCELQGGSNAVVFAFSAFVKAALSDAESLSVDAPSAGLLVVPAAGGCMSAVGASLRAGHVEHSVIKVGTERRISYLGT